MTDRQVRVLGGVLSLAVVIVMAAVTMGAKVSSPAMPAAQFDGWSYHVGSDPDGSRYAQVDFDRSSVASLQRYAAVNRALVQQLHSAGESEFNVLITLRRPMAIDDFKLWIKMMPLVLDTFQVRLSGTGSGSWILTGTPDRSGQISDADLNRNLQRLATKGATNVQGIIVVDARVRAGDYDTIANNPSVFLADVTRTATKRHAAQTIQGLDRRKFEVRVAPVYARMEQLGLDNFR